MPSPAADGLYAVETRTGWKLFGWKQKQWQYENGIYCEDEVAQWFGPLPEYVLFRDKDDPLRWS